MCWRGGCPCKGQRHHSWAPAQRKVVDKQDNVHPNAMVYITDTRSRATKTYIVGPDGTYRFPALSANVDYEVYAQFNGKSSDTKRVSQFDDRKVLNLHCGSTRSSNC